MSSPTDANDIITLPDRMFVVERARVEEYVIALGLEPERGWSAERDACVPGGFLMYVTTYGAEPILDTTGFDPLRLVFGATSVEMSGPVRIGDELRVECSISRPRERSSGEGTVRIVDVICHYVTGQGDIVAREKTTIIERENVSHD
jgi:hypothetical protein